MARAVSVGELKDTLRACLAEVRRGEEILVRDGNTSIAKIVPLRAAADHDAELSALAAEGKVRLPARALPRGFFASRARRSKSNALLEIIRAERDVVRGLEGEPIFPARSYAQLTPGKAVRAFRELAGLTQAQLAKRARLTQPTISAIESGAVCLGLRRAEQIARALRIHPSLVAFRTSPCPVAKTCRSPRALEGRHGRSRFRL